MATVKKGILTSPPIWAKHLRPWGKRQFWKMERKAAKIMARRTPSQPSHFSGAYTKSRFPYPRS